MTNLKKILATPTFIFPLIAILLYILIIYIIWSIPAVDVNYYYLTHYSKAVNAFSHFVYLFTWPGELLGAFVGQTDYSGGAPIIGSFVVVFWTILGLLTNKIWRKTSTIWKGNKFFALFLSSIPAVVVVFLGLALIALSTLLS